MFKDDEMFASFKHIRCTPQYWKEMQHDTDLIPSLYLARLHTFIDQSSSRLLQNNMANIMILITLQQKTKRNWLARNPVTIARHIDFIFRKLWGNVILSGLHPVGQILNYDIRKEMQSRATAHFHSAVHVKEAPIIDKNSDEEVISFVDKYVRCSRAKS